MFFLPIVVLYFSVKSLGAVTNKQAWTITHFRLLTVTYPFRLYIPHPTPSISLFQFASSGVLPPSYIWTFKLIFYLCAPFSINQSRDITQPNRDERETIIRGEEAIRVRWSCWIFFLFFNWWHPRAKSARGALGVCFLSWPLKCSGQIFICYKKIGKRKARDF